MQRLREKKGYHMLSPGNDTIVVRHNSGSPDLHTAALSTVTHGRARCLWGRTHPSCRTRQSLGRGGAVFTCKATSELIRLQWIVLEPRADRRPYLNSVDYKEKRQECRKKVRKEEGRVRGERTAHVYEIISEQV